MLHRNISSCMSCHPPRALHPAITKVTDDELRNSAHTDTSICIHYIAVYKLCVNSRRSWGLMSRREQHWNVWNSRRCGHELWPLVMNSIWYQPPSIEVLLVHIKCEFMQLTTRSPTLNEHVSASANTALTSVPQSPRCVTVGQPRQHSNSRQGSAVDAYM